MLPQALSRYTSQGDFCALSSAWDQGSVQSTTKSAKIHDFIVLRFSKSTMYFESSVSHLPILLEFSLYFESSVSHLPILELPYGHNDCVANLLHLGIILFGSN
jgi:hypothetical protein